MARNIFTKGTAITLAWHFTKPDGSSFDLSGYSLRLFYAVGSRYTEVQGFSLGTNATSGFEDFISWVFAADKQFTAGDYKMKLQLYQNGKLFTTFNYNDAFALYQGTPYSSNDEQQTEEAGVVNLYTAAEFYLFNPIIPVVGSDGFWYVDGVRVLDGSDNPVPSYYDVRYDEDTRWLSIYKGNPDDPGTPEPDPIQVIKDVDDALKHWNEQYLAEEGSLAESEAGDDDRWGQYKMNEGTLDGSEAGDSDRWGQYQSNEAERNAEYAAAEGTSSSSSSENSRWGEYKAAESTRNVQYTQQEGSKADSSAGGSDRWGQYKAAEAARDAERLTAEGTSSSSASENSRWGKYKAAENARDAARLTAEGNSGSTAGDGSRWGTYKTAENSRDAARLTAEGSAASTAGDGSRWGAYKTAEATRDTARETAEGSASSEAGDGTRWGAYKTAEANRNTARETAEGSSSSTAGDGSRWGAYKTAEAARNAAYADEEGSLAGSSATDNDRWGKFKANEEERNAAMAPLMGYFSCATAAATAAKEVTAADYILTSGGSVKIKFTYANSASSPTLNINSKGAKAIVYNGAVASATNTWAAGDVVEFYYDPTYNSNAGAYVGIPTVVSVSQNTLSIGGNYAGEMSTTYDVTLHSGQTFASLSALLSDANLNTLIPLVVRKGGMSIKFVQSSDNKYVQARCMAQNFTTDVTRWQGVDNVPIISSKNLVESGGVFNMFDEKLGTFGDRIFNSNNYCGFYYSASSEKIMPAVPTFNGIILPLKEGGIYCVRNGYSAHIFSSYPVLNSNAGFVRNQYIDNSFTAASGDKYILIDVQTQVTPTITVNYRVNGLQTDVDVLKAQMLIIEPLTQELDKKVNGDFTQITYPRITPGERLQKNIDCANGTYLIRLDLIEGVTETEYNIYARTSSNPQAKTLATHCQFGEYYAVEISDDQNTYVGFQIMTYSNEASGSSVGDIYKLSYCEIDERGLTIKVSDLGEQIDKITNNYNHFVFTDSELGNKFIKEFYIDISKLSVTVPNWGSDFYIHRVLKNHTEGTRQVYRIYLRNTPTYISDVTKIIFADNVENSTTLLANNSYGLYAVICWENIIDDDTTVKGMQVFNKPLDFSPLLYSFIMPNGINTINEMNANTNTDFSNLLKTVGTTPMASWIDDDGYFDQNGGNIQNVIVPVAESVGIPITFGIVCDELHPLTDIINLIGGGTTTKKDYMMSLQKKGHQFTAHPTHTGWYGDDYDITVVEPLLIECLCELQKANMLHSNMLIYPGSSSTNQEIVEIVRKWCVCAVRAGYGTPNHLGDSTKWQIKRTFINFENYYELHHNDDGFVSSMQWYKDQVDAAYENGDWIVFGSHSWQFTTSDDTSNPNANTKGNLALLMNYVVSKGLQFRTLYDAYNRRKYLFEFNEINV